MTKKVQSLWKFRYRHPRISNVLAGVVEASCFENAVEVSRLWCTNNSCQFLSQVQPFVLATEALLSNQQTKEEFSDERIAGLSIGDLKPLIESALIEPKRAYEVELAKPSGEVRQAVISYLEGFLNMPKAK